MTLIRRIQLNQPKPRAFDNPDLLHIKADILAHLVKGEPV
jgi:NitT/TauT family transport system ATP-binding protein